MNGMSQSSGSTMTSARAESPSTISGRAQEVLIPAVSTLDYGSLAKLGGTMLAASVIVIEIVSVFSVDWATLEALNDSRVSVYCPLD